MNKLILAVMLSGLVACDDGRTEAYVLAENIAVAQALCAPNGGLLQAKRVATCPGGRGCRFKYWTKAECVNGAGFVKEETP